MAGDGFSCPLLGGLAGTARDAPEQVAAAASPAALEFGSYLAGHYAFRVRDFGAASRYMSEALSAQPAGTRLLRRALIAKLANGQAETGACPCPAAGRSRSRARLIAKLTLAVGDLKAGRFKAAKARLSTSFERGPKRIHRIVAVWPGPRSGSAATTPLSMRHSAQASDNPAFAALHSFHTALILDLAGRSEEAEQHYLDCREADAAADIAVGPGDRFLLPTDGQRRPKPGGATPPSSPSKARSPLIESALDDLRQGRTGSPYRHRTGEQGAAEVFFNAAGMGVRARSIELALTYGQFALDLRPDFPSARVLVGRVLESVGRDEDAIAAYGLVDRASPLSWSARLQRAGGLARLDRDDEAIGMLRQMAAERAERSDALTRLGDIFRNRKRFPESVEAYDAAIARIGSIEPRHWRLLFSRGISLERSKNWPRAEKDLMAALELSPDEPYLLNYLGYSWVDQGIKLKDARRMIERAVELEPQSGAIVDSLGWALYRIGDYEAAVEQLERAVELEPLDPTVNDHLGDAYWRVGRRNEALFQWRRALDLDPEPERVSAIEHKIAGGLSDASGGDGIR